MAQYAKTAQVRQSILDACLSAFADVGFSATSMAEIARRAGISHTGLLHHFPHKEDLLTAVLDLEDERSAAFLAQHADRDLGSQALAVLGGMVEILVRRDKVAGLLELKVALTGEATNPSHPAHEHFAQRYADIHHFLVRVFRTLAEEGRLTTTLDPVQVATLTIAVIEGASIQELYGRDPREIEKTVHAFLASMVEGLPEPAPTPESAGTTRTDTQDPM